MNSSRWHERALGGKYFIADIGVNHGCDMKAAKRMIDQISSAGWDCAKFQIYTAGTIARRESPAYWDLTKEPSTTQYELFQKYDGFSEGHYRELAAHCAARGVDFCGTVFNEEYIDIYDDLMPFYKVASADITNLVLIDKILERQKDIILSTGASQNDEVSAVVQYILENKSHQSKLILLHCVLNYPTDPSNANLNRICTLQRAYPELEIGYSDHVPPGRDALCLITAYLLGAKVIEKHFTFDKSLPGNDHYHAYDGHDAANFARQVAEMHALMGDGGEAVTQQASARQHARRSLVARLPINPGDVLTHENVTALRPGDGLSPLSWPELKGRRARAYIPQNQLISREDIC